MANLNDNIDKAKNIIADTTKKLKITKHTKKLKIQLMR